MCRIEGKNLGIGGNRFADKEFVAVLGKPDPLKLAFRRLRVLGDALGNLLGVESAPV